MAEHDLSGQPPTVVRVKVRQRPVFWLTLAASFVALISIAVPLFAGVRTGTIPPQLDGVLIALGIGVVLFGWFRLTSDARFRRAEELFPGALIFAVVVSPDLSEQLRSATVALAQPRSKIRPTSYATVVADTAAIRFLAGFGRGEPAASIPVASIVRVGIGSSLVGARVLPSIDIAVASTGFQRTISIIPMRSRGNQARKLPDAELAALRDRIHLLVFPPPTVEAGR